MTCGEPVSVIQVSRDGLEYVPGEIRGQVDANWLPVLTELSPLQPTHVILTHSAGGDGP